MLNWTPGLPGQWYWVYENGSSTPLTYPATHPWATIGGLTNGTTYTFSVTTIAPGDGESAHSNTVSVTPRATPPNAPTELTATSNADGSITLNWNQVASGDWYWIYYCDNDGTNCGQPNPGNDGYTKLADPDTTTTFTQTGLANGDRYIYYVQSIGTNGALSGPSDTAQAVSVIAPPTNLTATANKDGTVTLNWSAPPPSGTGKYYWIYANGTRSVDPLYVTTAYAGQESKASNAVAPSRRLAAPTGLTGWMKTVTSGMGGLQCESLWGPDCRIHLQWNAVTGADHYDIYQLNDSADQPNFGYIGSAYTDKLTCTSGCLRRISLLITSSRSGHMAAVNRRTLTIITSFFERFGEPAEHRRSARGRWAKVLVFSPGVRACMAAGDLR